MLRGSALPWGLRQPAQSRASHLAARGSLYTGPVPSSGPSPLRVQPRGLRGPGHWQRRGALGGEELHRLPGSLHLPAESGHPGDTGTPRARPHTQPHWLVLPGLGLGPQTPALLQGKPPVVLGWGRNRAPGKGLWGTWPLHRDSADSPPADWTPPQWDQTWRPPGAQ